MVNKKLLAMSYCFIFISIYFMTIVYASLSLYFEKEYKINLPQTTTSNSTITALSSFSSWSSIPIFLIIIVGIGIVLFFIITGGRAMAQAV